jgi:hypothetical protein
MARHKSTPRRRVPAQAFIFQSRTDRYDLRTELHPKGVETWVASRYRSAMRPGDVVFFWLAGPEAIRGIYGWGTIKRYPYHGRSSEDYDVDVLVEHVFVQPLLAINLRQVPGLSDLLIFRAPQATTFLLSPEETRNLLEEIQKRGEVVPQQLPTSATTVAPGRQTRTAHQRSGVFICYSHADSEWLKRLQIHLTPLERAGGFQFWDDTRIRPGEQWRREISAAMAVAKVAILLVSADFLASRFIMENELPALLAAAADEGAIVLVIVAAPCRYLETTSISRFQAVNSPARPLSVMTSHEREDVFYRTSIAVEAALARAQKSHD